MALENHHKKNDLRLNYSTRHCRRNQSNLMVKQQNSRTRLKSTIFTMSWLMTNFWKNISVWYIFSQMWQKTPLSLKRCSKQWQLPIICNCYLSSSQWSAHKASSSWSRYWRVSCKTAYLKKCLTRHLHLKFSDKLQILFSIQLNLQKRRHFPAFCMGMRQV